MFKCVAFNTLMLNPEQSAYKKRCKHSLTAKDLELQLYKFQKAMLVTANRIFQILQMYVLTYAISCQTAADK